MTQQSNLPATGLPPAAIVIGAGPAGLMAAQMLAQAGLPVTVADRMPSLGRKMLMAGKSGLNMTKDDPIEACLAAFGEGAGLVPDLVRAFGPSDVQDWAKGLGQDIFTGSSGRVFPVAMKASPLLRAWLGHLTGLGVVFRTRWTWIDWQDGPVFDTPDGVQQIPAAATVLALGGASWPRLGSDAAWLPILRQMGCDIADFAPANAAIRVDWSDHMTPHFGQSVKAVALATGPTWQRGEFVISAQGLEGGGIYTASRAVREGAALSLDLCPDVDIGKVAMRLSAARGSISNRLRKALRLPPVKIALLMEFGRPLPTGDDLARLIKCLPVRHQGLAPLDRAISSAGGVRWSAVNETLMLRCQPGLFVCGEMLDWEAPTGGYLMTACLATGRHAGQSAAAFVQKQHSELSAHPTPSTPPQDG